MPPVVTSLMPRTSQSCKIMRPIPNVHDKPESLCRQPTTGNLTCPVEFTIIPLSRMLDARQQWRPTESAPRGHPRFFGRLSDRVPVQVLTSDFHHQTLQKKKSTVWRSEIIEVQLPFELASFWPLGGRPEKRLVNAAVFTPWYFLAFVFLFLFYFLSSCLHLITEGEVCELYADHRSFRSLSWDCRECRLQREEARVDYRHHRPVSQSCSWLLSIMQTLSPSDPRQQSASATSMCWISLSVLL